jgi:predicted enzyme related to lactoylglutathione lyase
MTSGATLYAKHLEVMASFYRACFTMAEVAAEPGDYRVLESDTWTLTIVQVPADVAATIELVDPPTRREGTPIKLTFDVASMTAARRTISEGGGHVDEQVWDFRGFRHCDFVDPEGNVGQLREQIP